MTFYTYNVINKSGAVLNQAYFSQWTDVDLGCANNDRVGCDTSRNLAIQYNGYVQGGTQVNGVTSDEGNVCPTQEMGYGRNLPMIGLEILEGATDTVIDPNTQLPQKRGMTSFCYYTNGAPTGQNDPSTPQQFRNYQMGYWADGTPITYGGTGLGGTIRTMFTFPGQPSITNQWSECNVQTGPAMAAGDRRFVQTSGPFTFMPCASQFFTIAVVFVQPPGGVGSNCPSWAFIDTAADKAKSLFNTCFQHQNPFPLAVENIRTDNVKAYPNPVSSLLFFATSGQQIDEVYVYDLMGRIVLYQATRASSIDMSKLSAGVYFVKTNSDTEQTFRIVKN